MDIQEFVQLAIKEDIKDGDHSALACIPKDAIGQAQLLVKENGIIPEYYNDFVIKNDVHTKVGHSYVCQSS